MNKLKVDFLFVNRWYGATGGVVRYLNALKEYLGDRKILTGSLGMMDLPHQPTHRSVAGINLAPWISRFPKGRNLFLAASDHLYSRKLYQKFHDEFADADFPIEFMDIHAEALAFIGNRKYFIRAHNPSAVVETNRIFLSSRVQQEIKCLRAAESISTPSHHLKNYLVARYEIPASKIQVISNPIKCSDYASLPGSSKSQIILNVGRFETNKGMVPLLKAFHQISRNNNNVKLVIVGEVRFDSEELVNTWKELTEGTRERITLAGNVPFDTVRNYYAQAKVFVIPSLLQESFSYPTVEALCCGLPVVGFSRGAIPEVLGPFSEGLTSSTEWHELADLLAEALKSDQNVRRAQERYNYVKNNFDISVVGPQLMQFYFN